MTSPVPPLDLAAGPTVAARSRVDRHWALFADWCTATGRCSLPATPDTVAAFLAEVPAGPATVRRRVRAIDAAHHASGLDPPGGNPSPARPLPARFDPGLVADALRAIPVGGWPTGIIGRRDAALVALVCSAGMTRRQAQALRTGPENFTGAGAAVVGRAGYPGSCPACALTRWQRLAALTATVGWRRVRIYLADLGEATAGSETDHDCAQPITWPTGGRGQQHVTADTDGIDDQSGSGETVAGDRMPLFSAIDRHGVPEATWALSTRSITTIIATRLSAAHQLGDDESTRHDSDATRGSRGSWSAKDRARVLQQRKAAIDRLADLEHMVDQADAYAETILDRLDVDLASTIPDPR